jgi:SAM-dependent methyltransferase
VNKEIDMLRNEDKYALEFDPKEYLNEYYLIEPDVEDRFVVEFMVKALPKMPSDLLTLEFGGGPTLFAVATLAPRSREIHFCDYVTANLDEVRRWLADEPDAFDWTSYIKLSLEIEGQPTTPEAVAERRAEMRRKVTRLSRCDALSDNPLDRCELKYDLVVAQTVTDTAANNLAEWMRIMRNIGTLVAPGGWFLISVLTGTRAYVVGDKRFPYVDLSDEDIYRGYLAAGFDPETFYFERIDAPTGRSYAGVASATARKLTR